MTYQNSDKNIFNFYNSRDREVKIHMFLSYYRALLTTGYGKLPCAN